MPKQPSIKLKKELASIIAIFSLLAVLGLSFINIKSFFDANQKQKEVLGAETTLSQEKDYWVNLLNTQKDYLPGWVQLAKIDKELGDIAGYQDALNNVKRINPNSDELSSLEGN